MLEVAGGRKQELRIGDRTIHSPNKGRGYRNMPQNPKGIAWAVKQYNGFGGNWRGQKESSQLPKEKNMVRRLVRRYKAASGAGISYDEIEADLWTLFKAYQVYVRQAKPLMEYLERCAKLLRSTDLVKHVGEYQNNFKGIEHVLKSMPGALKEIRNPKRSPNWQDLVLYSQAGHRVLNQRDVWGLVFDELWNSPQGHKLADRIKIIPVMRELLEDDIRHDIQQMKGKKPDEWGWRR